MLAVVTLLAVAKPPPDDKVSPGLLGFLVTFALVLATVLLMRSMVGHLRKVRYSPDPAEAPSPTAERPDDGSPRSQRSPDGEPQRPKTGESP